MKTIGNESEKALMYCTEVLEIYRLKGDLCSDQNFIV